MKTLPQHINESINEAKNTKSMFVGATSKRAEEDFAFTPGETALLIKYTTHHYEVQLRGLVTVNKVNKNSMSIVVDDNESMTEFYKTYVKFDKKGIAVNKNKNKYTGNSTTYWVLYNKDLINEFDITELIEKGSSMWGFSFPNRFKEENIKELKEYVDTITKES